MGEDPCARNGSRWNHGEHSFARRDCDRPLDRTHSRGGGAAEDFRRRSDETHRAIHSGRPPRHPGGVRRSRRVSRESASCIYNGIVDSDRRRSDQIDLIADRFGTNDRSTPLFPFPRGKGLGVRLLRAQPKNRSSVIMSAIENKEIIRTMFAELGKGNADAFLGAMSDDVKFTLIGNTKFSGTFNGKQEFIATVLPPLAAPLEDA